MFISYKRSPDLLIAHDCVEKLEDLDGSTYWLDEEDEIKPLKADIEVLKIGAARLDGRLTAVEGRLTSIEKQILHSGHIRSNSLYCGYRRDPCLAWEKRSRTKKKN